MSSNASGNDICNCQSTVALSICIGIIIVVIVVIYALQRPCLCLPPPTRNDKEGFLALKNAKMYRNRDTDLVAKRADIEDIQNRVDISMSNAPKNNNVDNIHYRSVNNGDNQEVRRRLEKTSLNNSKKIRMINDSQFLKNSLEGTKPTKGYSKANTRVNSKMDFGIGSSREVNKLSGLTIDDKGYGNMENFQYTGNDTASISCNSRLCGSNMNLETIYGTCLKKYDDSNDFWTDKNPHHPELSLLKGKPLKLSYKPNNDL